MTQTETPFTLALVQMPVAVDPDQNLAHACGRVSDAADGGADVVCLPELFRSRYFCQREDPACFDLAEPIPGSSTEHLAEVARDSSVVIVAPLFERRTRGLYHNSLVVIDRDGSIAGLYRKMHIPDDPNYYEKFYFAPGDTGFQAVSTSVGSLGTLICWDQWYPEAARLTALQGASVLLYPTAIGWLPGEKEADGAAQKSAWQTIQRSHAIANNVYLAAVNRIGFEPAGDDEKDGIEFWGSSFICDPRGQVIAEASEAEEAILYAEIDPAQIEASRRTWPFLRDRRIDAYDGLTQRFLDRGHE